MIPANEWWGVLQHYSQSVFPVQIIFYLLSVAAVVGFFARPSKAVRRWIEGFFVLSFGWIGLLFFLLLGQKLPAHNAQAFLFVTLALLFAVDLFTDTFHYQVPERGWRWVMTVVAFALVLAYPLFGLLQGRVPARWIVPGTFPCPTSGLALVFMSTNLPVRRRWLYLVTLGLLLVWALPFPLLIQIPQFGVYEDGIMLATGLFALVMSVLDLRETLVFAHT